MSTTKTSILGSVVWALAFIGAALVFKGHPLQDWIQGVLFVGFMVFLASQSAGGSSCRLKLGRRE